MNGLFLPGQRLKQAKNLGFLPGDLTQKVDPYLRPLYDALYDFMGPDAYTRFTERGIVEVAPLGLYEGENAIRCLHHFR